MCQYYFWETSPVYSITHQLDSIKYTTEYLHLELFDTIITLSLHGI